MHYWSNYIISITCISHMWKSTLTLHVLLVTIVHMCMSILCLSVTMLSAAYISIILCPSEVPIIKSILNIYSVRISLKALCSQVLALFICLPLLPPSLPDELLIDRKNNSTYKFILVHAVLSMHIMYQNGVLQQA